jgi:signal peptidase I
MNEEKHGEMTPAGDKKNPKEEPSMKSIVLDWVKAFVIALIIALAITAVIRPTIVRETSMLPNIQDGNYVFVYKLAYKTHNPQKGDVIVFKSNIDNGKRLIKRVIGVPGDTITIKSGEVYINGKKDDQSYTNDKWTTGEITNLKVTKGHYFCMGDNRIVSRDSRDSSVGLVAKDKIIGKAVFRLFPLSEIGTIKNPYTDK